MLVLGFDGMDPGIVNRLMSRGELPNMQRLGARGTFTMMRSTIPPQSPVAWGSFISGADPGVHGIFDFVHRDPKTYFPMFSLTETLPSGMMVNLGKYRIPLKSGKVVLKREGPAFWDHLEERGIPATIVKVPTNFPPSASKQRTLAGMGTPDVLGGYGIYSLYTSDENESAGRPVSRQRLLRLHRREQRHGGADRGPEERPGQGRRSPSSCRSRSTSTTATRRRASTSRATKILIAEKEYSDWVEIEFSLISHLASVTGMVKFYLMEMGEQASASTSPPPISARARPPCPSAPRRATAASWPTRSASSTPSACRPTPRR